MNKGLNQSVISASREIECYLDRLICFFLSFQAWDADSGRGGVVAFSPLRGYNAGFFAISKDGVVTVAEGAKLDWELMTEFYFTVEVS